MRLFAGCVLAVATLTVLPLVVNTLAGMPVVVVAALCLSAVMLILAIPTPRGRPVNPLPPCPGDGRSRSTAGGRDRTPASGVRGRRGGDRPRPGHPSDGFGAGWR